MGMVAGGECGVTHAEAGGDGGAPFPVDVARAGWEALGGHSDVVRQLKEMVLLPLMYPELFKSMGVTGPRCVRLFFGGGVLWLPNRDRVSYSACQIGQTVSCWFHRWTALLTALQRERKSARVWLTSRPQHAACFPGSVAGLLTPTGQPVRGLWARQHVMGRCTPVCPFPPGTMCWAGITGRRPCLLDCHVHAASSSS
jgi:hypothetical protein